MGVVGGNEDGESALGVECSGVVKELGPGVSDFQVGDRIAATATGSYSTTLIAKTHGCVKIPHGLSFEEAATMPSVFGTVIYSLLELARLEAGQVSPIVSPAMFGVSYLQWIIECADTFSLRWDWYCCNPNLPLCWSRSVRHGRQRRQSQVSLGKFWYSTRENI